MKKLILIFLLLASAAQAEKVYDNNYKLQYRTHDQKVYDTNYRLKYRIKKDGKVYDTNYRLKYRIKSTPGHNNPYHIRRKK